MAALAQLVRQSEEKRVMNSDRETFDAQVEVERIRARRAEARRRLYRRSRLDRYRAELVAMRRAGASCADLVEWLRVKHRCRINRSSVDRYLRKLPELATTAPSKQDR
jgi:hypothetical protein